jgi:hypothetical protein
MLDSSPEHQLAWVRSRREVRPALIQLTGDAEPELFADLDPVLVGKSEPRDLKCALPAACCRAADQLAIVASPAMTSVGTIGFSVTGLAVHPSTGVLYGVWAGGGSVATCKLITVNGERRPDRRSPPLPGA